MQKVSFQVMFTEGFRTSHKNLRAFSCKYISCIYSPINYICPLKRKIFLLSLENKMHLFNSGRPEVAVLNCTKMGRLCGKE